MFKNIILVFLSLFILSSCGDYYAEKEKLKLSKQKDLIIKQSAEDKSTCMHYGFKENTASFSDCLMNLDIARKQAIFTRKMLECEAVRRDNNQSAATGFWAGVLKGARENLACN